LTQQAGEKLPKQKRNRKIFSALAAFCGFAITLLQLYQYSFTKTTDPAIEVNVSSIGRQMVGVNDTGYALPFEVISMLLLAAMIGCIVIALRAPKKTEEINIISS